MGGEVASVRSGAVSLVVDTWLFILRCFLTLPVLTVAPVDFSGTW